MKFRNTDDLVKILKRDIWFYLTIVLMLVIGISIGAIAAKVLDFSNKKSLLVFMNNYFQIMDKDSLNNLTIAINAVKRNFQPVFFIWLISITAVGVPVILFIVSFYGFVLGFTVAFLVEGMGLKGLVFTLIAVLPQNIIYIPCLIAISYLGLKFSINVLKKYINRRNMYNYSNNITNHTLYCAFIFLIMNIGALFEAYFSPTVIKAISSYFVIK